MSTSPQTPAQSIGESWNERMRMIRLRRKKEAFRFRDEFRIIPRWLKILCVVLYIVALVIGITVMKVSPDARFPELRDDVVTSIAAIIGIITGVAIVLSSFIFM